MLGVHGRSELQELLEQANFPAGTAVAVGISGSFGPDVVATLGSTHNGVGITENTTVYVGSLAKQVTAACAAVLIKAGRLDADDRIINWLTELPGWAQCIRVRHLIHHSADLPDESTLLHEMQRAGAGDRTTPGILRALGVLRSHRARPGSRYAYSNCGYVCLAKIVERVASQLLAEYAKDNFFRPLKMANTSF